MNHDLVFAEYVKRYDVRNPKIALKIKHMYNVEELCYTIASEIGCNDYDINVAEIIGLLHDIGRFYQIENYDTFVDEISVDHADIGAKLLFEDGLISLFFDDKSYYSIMEKAIKNHNKLSIEEGLTHRQLLFSKIVRDADKIDIYRVMADEDFNEASFGTYDEDIGISPKVLQAFYSKSLVKNEFRVSAMDDYVLKMAYVFDLNFDVSKAVLKQLGYLELFANKFISRFKNLSQDTLSTAYGILLFASDYLSN